MRLIMDKQMEQNEQKYFLKTEEKIEKQIKELLDIVEKGKQDIKKQKEFVWENGECILKEVCCNPKCRTYNPYVLYRWK